MTVAEFTNVLVAEMEADEATTFVETLITDARAAIAGGKGTIASLTSSSLNGKAFTRTIDLSPVQVLQACRQALKIYNETDDAVSSTRPDFRSLMH